MEQRDHFLGPELAETDRDLTAQEEQTSRLAAEGMINPEIGAQLFLSPWTVEWHLRTVLTWIVAE